jgi:hypothetical protein
MEIEHQKQNYPLILTLRLDTDSQAFFNEQRKLYFPTERNYLEAHLSLFHQLPNEKEVFDFLKNLDISAFQLQVTGLMNLGAGVAYRVDSPELIALRKSIAGQFSSYLIPQDQQGFRPHITVMNKSTPELARALLAELSVDFQQFSITATGLDLWSYLGGPWRHEQTFFFEN